MWTVEDNERIAGYVYLSNLLYQSTRWFQIRVQKSYNDLDPLPQAMSDSLQLRLRPPRENAAHMEFGATNGTSCLK